MPLFKHYIPEAPPAMFQVVESTPGLSYWEAQVFDALQGDAPYFRAAVPKRAKAPADPMDMAALALKEANEGLGRCTLTEVRDGVPVFVGTFESLPVIGGRMSVCLSTTDHARCPVTIRSRRC